MAVVSRFIMSHQAVTGKISLNVATTHDMVVLRASLSRAKQGTKMKNKVFAIILGVLSIVAGIFCLINPLAGSLASTLIAGWSFLILGAIQLFVAFRETGWGSRIWALLLGVLGVLAGISLLSNPLEGVLTLTVILGVLFLVTGIMKFVAGFALPSGNLKLMVIISGAISAILGLMILSDFPGSAVVTLGVLLGVELIADGIAVLGLANADRSRA